jgi:heptosyltransferase III
LVVRAGALGDVLLGLPALRTLRRRFPRADTTFVAPLPQGRTALWEPIVDRVVGFDEPSLAQLIAGTAAQWPPALPLPDLAVVWLRDHARLAETLRRLGVGHAVGYAPLDAIAQRRHIADWLCASLKALGVGAPPEPDRLVAPVRGTAGESASAVIHPGSGSSRKNWPGWAEALARLRPERVSVLAGPADEHVVRTLLNRWPSGIDPPAVRAGLSLDDLAGVLAGATLYLGNDSGVTHLAAALATPTVAVFGPTDPRIWRPVGPRVEAVGGTRVESGIFASAPEWPAVDAVVEAARRLLAQAE